MEDTCINMNYQWYSHFHKVQKMFQKDGCNFLIFTELDYKVLIAFKTHGMINRTSSGKKIIKYKVQLILPYFI